MRLDILPILAFALSLSSPQAFAEQPGGNAEQHAVEKQKAQKKMEKPKKSEKASKGKKAGSKSPENARMPNICNRNNPPS